MKIELTDSTYVCSLSSIKLGITLTQANKDFENFRRDIVSLMEENEKLKGESQSNDADLWDSKLLIAKQEKIIAEQKKAIEPEVDSRTIQDLRVVVESKDGEIESRNEQIESLQATVKFLRKGSEEREIELRGYIEVVARDKNTISRLRRTIQRIEPVD